MIEQAACSLGLYTRYRYVEVHKLGGAANHAKHQRSDQPLPCIRLHKLVATGRLELPAGELAIVVLGTGFNPDPLLPANSQVGGTFLSRLLEGVRLWRARPDALLVVSVAGTASEGDKRCFWQQMQLLLGLAAAEVALLTTAESTLDEAFLVRDMVQGRSVVLATSAGHMPRAMRIFADEGLSVTAAPTDYGMPRSGSAKDSIWHRWVPSVDGVVSNHAWLYELVAGVWQYTRSVMR